jgi:hypothetical protein
MSPIIHFKCRACDAEIRIKPQPLEQVQCPSCGQATPIQIDEALLRHHQIATCVSCGHENLYIQKDFNRAVGIGIVTVGIVLSIYFFARRNALLAMGCLFGTALADLLLHFMVRDVTVCYSCHAIYRGFRRNPEHEPFDLKKLEKYGGRTSRLEK